jgi:WD40 repeat protein
MLASGAADGTLRFWDVRSGNTVREILVERTSKRGVVGKVQAFAFSPDGKQVASGGSDRALYVHDVADGQLRAKLLGHTDAIRAVAWSPSGNVIASAGHDRTVRLWHARTLQPLRVLEGHGGQVRALAFSRDGSVVASACTDRELRLWETRTGAALALLPWHEAGVLALAWSRDGRLLASGSGDGVVDLLRLDDARELPPPEESLRRLLQRHWLKLSRLELVADPPPPAQ